MRPYILRRLKTDKTVIADLPDKTEVKAFCQLSRKQAALYEQAVKELAEQLRRCRGDSAQRSGVVVSDALQADLQSSIAVAGRRRLGRRRQRQMGAPARYCRGHRGQAGEDARLHAVPGGDRSAGGFSRIGFGAPRPGSSRRDRGEASARKWCADFRKTKPWGSSCFR